MSDQEAPPPTEKPSTVSIFQVLATMPSGRVTTPLRPEEFSRYLRENYGTQAEKDRNKRHAVRDELYRDGGVNEMATMVTKMFTDRTVRDLRLKWVRYARFNNVSKRIVNELSTVYSEPAKRIIGTAPQPPMVNIEPDDTDPAEKKENPEQDKYDALLELVRMDERMVEVNRLLNLHRALLVGFRVRQKPNGEREPVIDIATPANVRAIVHPNDPTEVAGWLIRTEFRTARPGLQKPEWMLWTDHESALLDENFNVITGSYETHSLGINPWVPVTLGPPAPGFWPGEEGEDIPAAHLTVWFFNILLEKEGKSATKQTILRGDGTSMARGQSADSETPLEMPDGMSAETVDMSMDLSQFRDTTDHVVYGVSNNYGMSPALVDHQGVQSAQARELMRMPLREIRRQQQLPLRRFEAQLAIVMSVVCAADLPEYTFDPTGWRIEFSESETPLDPVSEMKLFVEQRAAGLTNTVEFIQKKRPGISYDDAMALIEENVAVELARNVLMRPLQAIQGTLDAAIEGATVGARVDAAAVIDDGTGAPVSPGAPMNAPTPSGRADTRTQPPPKKPGGGNSGAPAQAA